MYGLQEFEKMSDAPQPYLMEHLVFKNKGRLVLVAKPKIGICIAQGKPLFGFKTNMSRVIYLDFDHRYQKNTIDALTSDFSGEFYYIQPDFVALNEKAGLEYLDGLAKGWQPGLIIIDHKSACFSGKENDDDTTRKWIQTLNVISDKYGVSFLILCQAPKSWGGGTEDIIDLPFGSRILTAWADTIISLSQKGKNFRMLESVSNYDSIEAITYDAHFIALPEEVKTNKTDGVKEALLARWEECKPPNISKIIEEVSKEIGCGYKTTWGVYREIRDEKRLDNAQKEQARSSDESKNS